LKSFTKLLTTLLAVFSLFAVSGCGGSDNDDPVTDPVGGSSGRVAHVNWNSYNLYAYQNNAWTPVITQGAVVGTFPAIGDRPSLLIHGLGSDIVSGRFNALANSLQQSGATSVFGFEYDSLDSVAKNGNFLIEAIGALTEENPGQTWRLMGHSMGALVARVALESGIPFDVAATGNRAALVAGPHLGSEIAVELQDNPDLIGQALGDLVVNGQLEFRNADGQLVSVSGQEQGFTDLRPDSAFLATQNFEAANKHPQFEYRTVAGDDRGTNYETLNRVLGVFADDGVVDISSASAAVIGPLDSAIVDADHSTIVEALDPIVVILTYLGF
jgi:pimeloyl-ACP methyl ester carboxylesterase